MGNPALGEKTRQPVTTEAHGTEQSGSRNRRSLGETPRGAQVLVVRTADDCATGAGLHVQDAQFLEGVS